MIQWITVGLVFFIGLLGIMAQSEETRIRRDNMIKKCAPEYIAREKNKEPVGLECKLFFEKENIK